MASNPRSSSMSSARPRIALEADAIAWIVNVLGNNDIVEIESLKSGVALCQLINKLKPGTILKINKLKQPYMQMENIKNFLDGCRALGLTDKDLFVTVDLFESKNLGQVAHCLTELAIIAKGLNTFAGPYITLNNSNNRPQPQRSSSPVPLGPSPSGSGGTAFGPNDSAPSTHENVNSHTQKNNQNNNNHNPLHLPHSSQTSQINNNNQNSNNNSSHSRSSSYLNSSISSSVNGPSPSSGQVSDSNVSPSVPTHSQVQAEENLAATFSRARQGSLRSNTPFNLLHSNSSLENNNNSLNLNLNLNLTQTKCRHCGLNFVVSSESLPVVTGPGSGGSGSGSGSASSSSSICSLCIKKSNTSNPDNFTNDRNLTQNMHDQLKLLQEKADQAKLIEMEKEKLLIELSDRNVELKRIMDERNLSNETLNQLKEKTAQLESDRIALNIEKDNFEVKLKAALEELSNFKDQLQQNNRRNSQTKNIENEIRFTYEQQVQLLKQQHEEALSKVSRELEEVRAQREADRVESKLKHLETVKALEAEKESVQKAHEATLKQILSDKNSSLVESESKIILLKKEFEIKQVELEDRLRLEKEEFLMNGAAAKERDRLEAESRAMEEMRAGAIASKEAIINLCKAQYEEEFKKRAQIQEKAALESEEKQKIEFLAKEKELKEHYEREIETLRINSMEQIAQRRASLISSFSNSTDSKVNEAEEKAKAALLALEESKALLIQREEEKKIENEAKLKLQQQLAQFESEQSLKRMKEEESLSAAHKAELEALKINFEEEVARMKNNVELRLRSEEQRLAEQEAHLHAKMEKEKAALTEQISSLESQALQFEKKILEISDSASKSKRDLELELELLKSELASKKEEQNIANAVESARLSFQAESALLESKRLEERTKFESQLAEAEQKLMESNNALRLLREELEIKSRDSQSAISAALELQTRAITQKIQAEVELKQALIQASNNSQTAAQAEEKAKLANQITIEIELKLNALKEEKEKAETRYQEEIATLRSSLANVNNQLSLENSRQEESKKNLESSMIPQMNALEMALANERIRCEQLTIAAEQSSQREEHLKNQLKIMAEDLRNQALLLLQTQNEAAVYKAELEVLRRNPLEAQTTNSSIISGSTAVQLNSSIQPTIPNQQQMPMVHNNNEEVEGVQAEEPKVTFEEAYPSDDTDLNNEAAIKARYEAELKSMREAFEAQMMAEKLARERLLAEELTINNNPSESIPSPPPLPAPASVPLALALGAVNPNPQAVINSPSIPTENLLSDSSDPSAPPAAPSSATASGSLRSSLLAEIQIGKKLKKADQSRSKTMPKQKDQSLGGMMGGIMNIAAMAAQRAAARQKNYSFDDS